MTSELCPECLLQPRDWFCDGCDLAYCDGCWLQRGPHIRKEETHVKHPYTTYEAARAEALASSKKWDDILKPSWTSTERLSKHKADGDALWFSIDNEAGTKAFEFEDCGRYFVLASEHRHAFSKHKEFFPRLISFIGHTGGGKSTLIRALIERPWLVSQSTDPISVPVVGIRNDDAPTSGDVHLYRDPAPEQKDFESPLFYADCEGFYGGQVAPIGSKAIQQAKILETPGDLSQFSIPRKAISSFWKGPGSKFQIEWQDKGLGLRRDTAVSQLFPRLLYTFSDVVVYVMNTAMARTIETAMLQLLTWAEKSRDASINRPSLPHCIIVFNEAKPHAEWNSTKATEALLQKHSRLIDENQDIRLLKQKWENLNTPIRSLKDLLHCSYSSIQVVWIPTGDEKPLLAKQMSGLYELIDKKSAQAQDRKREAGLLLSSKDQQTLFRMAFRHYSRKLDEPFDYIKECFALRPIPNDLSHHLCEFLGRMYKSCPNSNNRAESFLQAVTPVIASTIALDRARNSETIPGTLINVYDGHSGRVGRSEVPEGHAYGVQVKKAFDLLCDRLPCEYRITNWTTLGGLDPDIFSKCVNVPHGHSGGHQNTLGTVFATGVYESIFAEKLEHLYDDQVRAELEITEAAILRLNPFPSTAERRDAAWSIQANNMKKLHLQNPRLDTRCTTVCFWCIREVPFKVLRCGHAICLKCAESCRLIKGEQDDRILIMNGCFLHAVPEKTIETIQLKPKMAGVRILSLDGGGVRGIIEVRILKAIEEELGNRFRIQRFFDLIGGTSTGALLALGLGTKDWTLDQCESKYRTLCNEAFKEWTGGLGKYVALLAKGSLYQTTPLEQALYSEFGPEILCTAKIETGNMTHTPFVFATATIEDGNTATIMANYIRKQEENADKSPEYRFEISDNLDQSFRLWESARASCAAPGYFKAFEKHSLEYFDGGLYNNNPSHIASLESKIIWPEVADILPDLLLSIGSGHGQPQKSKPEVALDFDLDSILKFLRECIKKSYIYKTCRVFKNRFKENLNSEKLWQTYFEELANKHSTRFVRLNLKFAGPQPALDRKELLLDKSLTRPADEYIESQKDTIAGVARRLIATSFYYQPVGEIWSDGNGRVCQEGNIRSRFLDKSEEIRSLGDYLHEKVLKPRFKLLESYNAEWPLEKEQIMGMKLTGVLQIPVQWTIPTIVRHWTIILVGDNFAAEPISGFPREVPLQHVDSFGMEELGFTRPHLPV